MCEWTRNIKLIHCNVNKSRLNTEDKQNKNKK